MNNKPFKSRPPKPKSMLAIGRLHELCILAREPWRAWALGKRCVILRDDTKAEDNIDCVTSEEHELIYVAVMHPLTARDLLAALRAHQVVETEQEMAQILAFYAEVKKAV